ncbi:hypothetical protein VNO77_13108 [Canavalia gladiata]|uniref:RING-type E3 ubiquitin transferase n=1 Tax=Canavalia gladiata TaxID=3824 RepID=A0AAN9M2C4_CANGL
MKNSTSGGTTNNNEDNGSFDASGFTYGIAFVIGLIFLLVTIAFACVRLRMSRGPNMVNILAGFPPSGNAVEEMEQDQNDIIHQINTSFESYPKLLYSQVEKNNRGGSSMSCSICLGDYKESDMLRLLPDCAHLFHLACVDPWLRLHSTCPICRKSSLQQHSASN